MRGRRTFQWLSAVAILAIPIAVVAWLAMPRDAVPTTPLTTGQIPASPVTGVVIGVDSVGLGQVKSFTLRGEGGAAYSLALGNLENASEFSPSHLLEHMATSQPIRAFYRVESGVPTAYRLEDATGGSPGPT